MIEIKPSTEFIVDLIDLFLSYYRGFEPQKKNYSSKCIYLTFLIHKLIKILN